MNQTLTQAVGIVLPMIGGLGIFMLGIKYLSEGIQTVAGTTLRRLISKVTDNRLLATGTGTTVTLLVQSSTIATVIMVGLVNAGLMKLHQAVGFIMGANIGTTITGWVLVLQIGKHGLPVLGVAALVYRFTKRDRVRFIAMAVMGLGMVFFGLELMKEGAGPLREMDEVQKLVRLLAADSYGGVVACVVLGCLLTLVIQSSSAALGILIAAAATGLVPFPVAAAFILGENVGTTITVVIASLGANTNAKRAAFAHVLFNVIGVSWMLLAFPWAVRGIAGVVKTIYGVDPMTMTMADFESPTRYAAVITAAIATMHTSFNVANTLLFLPFVRRFTDLLEWLVPQPPDKEVAQLRHLDAGNVDAPVMGIEQSRGEVVQMGRSAVKMMDWIGELCFNGKSDPELVEKALHREKVLDNIEREIVAFLTDVLDGNVPHFVAEEGREQLRLAHEFESIGDYLASILKDFLRMRDHNLELSPEQRAELRELHEALCASLGKTVEAYVQRHPRADKEVRAESNVISKRVKALRELHLQRITETQINPGVSMAYASLLTNYHRVRAHILNAHQAMVGTKAHPRPPAKR